MLRAVIFGSVLVAGAFSQAARSSRHNTKIINFFIVPLGTPPLVAGHTY
jgi:hypothetical protein